MMRGPRNLNWSQDRFWLKISIIFIGLLPLVHYYAIDADWMGSDLGALLAVIGAVQMAINFAYGRKGHWRLCKAAYGAALRNIYLQDRCRRSSNYGPGMLFENWATCWTF
jgi:hypothetical protein